MTDTFSEGDLIEATYKDTLIRGRLTGLGQMPGVCRSPESLALDGYTIRTVEKAAPALPTESGFYAESDGSLWRLAGVEGSLEWLYLDGNTFEHSPCPEDFAPFTRLEPVADTAKKVLDDVAAYWEFGAPSNVIPALTSAAKNFGVVYE